MRSGRRQMECNTTARKAAEGSGKCVSRQKSPLFVRNAPELLFYYRRSRAPANHLSFGSERQAVPLHLLRRGRGNRGFMPIVLEVSGISGRSVRTAAPP